MSTKVATINLDNQDESFKELLQYNLINLKSEDKDNIFVNKNYVVDLMSEFVRIQVAKGNLIPKEDFLVDEPTAEQAKELSEIMKNSGF